MMIIKADSLILGRLSSIIAKILLNGEEVIILNAEKTLITGKKKMVFEEYKNMRRLSHARKGPHYPRQPDKILKRTIRGMIPYQTPRGRKAIKNLKVYIGIPKEFEGKKIQSIKEAHTDSLHQHVQLGDVSKYLGAKF
jgi:large subunit ribosomal protein L13